jgi:hypothetical protein
MLLASITGCVSEQPNNETSATPNPINITYTYCLSYNGTSYLTGVIKNVGTWNLLDISLQAEGYANNTTRELGYAGPQTGVNSTLLPGEGTPVTSDVRCKRHLRQSDANHICELKTSDLHKKYYF